MAYLLDDQYRIPGTNIRAGWDALIGLIPVVGEVVTIVFAFVLIGYAARAGIPRWTLVRMALNAAVDGVLGAVPILGDAFDIFFKANLRNARLAERHFAIRTAPKQ